MIGVAFPALPPRWVRWDHDEEQWLNEVTDDFFRSHNLVRGVDYTIGTGKVFFKHRLAAIHFLLTWGSA